MDDRGGIATALTIAAVAAVVFGLYSCSEHRKRAFREQCIRDNGAVIMAIDASGDVVLVCRPPGVTGDIVIQSVSRGIRPELGR